MKIIPPTDGLIPSNAITFTELHKTHPELQEEKEQNKKLESGDWVIQKVQVLSQQCWSLYKPHSDDIYHRFMFGACENPKNLFWHGSKEKISIIKSTDTAAMEIVLKNIDEIIQS